MCLSSALNLGVAALFLDIHAKLQRVFDVWKEVGAGRPAWETKEPSKKPRFCVL